jgi:hypothetical protein
MAIILFAKFNLVVSKKSFKKIKKKICLKNKAFTRKNTKIKLKN